MTRKTAINIILILLAAILGVVAYKLSPLLRATGDTVLPVSTCNPSAQACQVSLPNGGKVELSFAPRPIRPLQAFKAEMSVHDVKVSKAEIDFEGTTMKMGYYRPDLCGRRHPSRLRDRDDGVGSDRSADHGGGHDRHSVPFRSRRTMTP